MANDERTKLLDLARRGREFARFESIHPSLRRIPLAEAAQSRARPDRRLSRRLHGQRLPAGDGPRTSTGVVIIPDAGEQPAQFHRGR